STTLRRVVPHGRALAAPTHNLPERVGAARISRLKQGRSAGLENCTCRQLSGEARDILISPISGRSKAFTNARRTRRCRQSSRRTTRARLIRLPAAAQPAHAVLAHVAGGSLGGSVRRAGSSLPHRHELLCRLFEFLRRYLD